MYFISVCVQGVGVGGGGAVSVTGVLVVIEDALDLSVMVPRASVERKVISMISMSVSMI